MALDEYVTIGSTIKLGSTNLAIIFSAGVPDGDSSPQDDAVKGSLYLQTDATDDESPFWLKVDDASANDDWVQVFIDKCENALSLENTLTMDADHKLYFRDTDLYIHSNADGEMTISADTEVNIGDGTNQAVFAADGEITLEGTAKVTKSIRLDLDSQHGTATSESFQGAPSINLDADGETFYGSFEAPKDWDAASDLTIIMMVANEIAEDDGDDISIPCQVRGYADGGLMGDAGQAVAMDLNLTGGDEAINVVNKVTGTIDWDHGTYDIAAGDFVVIEAAVELGDGTECTGPLHVIEWHVEYVADKLGTAT